MRMWHPPFNLDTASRAEIIGFYDNHNGTTRTSSNPQERLYGQCGCHYCVRIRKEILSTLPAPIDTPNRKGNNNMAGVNLCDLCGAMVTGLALGAVQLRTSGDSATSEVITREICPGCVATLVAALESTMEPANKAYKQPWKRPEEKKERTASDLISELVDAKINERMAIEGKATRRDSRDQ